jgi:hypothetical protein
MESTLLGSDSIEQSLLTVQYSWKNERNLRNLDTGKANKTGLSGTVSTLTTSLGRLVAEYSHVLIKSDRSARL